MMAPVQKSQRRAHVGDPLRLLTSVGVKFLLCFLVPYSAFPGGLRLIESLHLVDGLIGRPRYVRSERTKMEEREERERSAL